jgi:ferredoxin-thioredoxin reductase catalytic subunit
MDAKELYERLRKIQEPKGYYFNKDMEMTMALMESLITCKERLGYMACPCRLANGDLESDRDIICPCVYREADVAEYGACFCGLYVSREFNEGTIEKQVVPERRPPEKILF